MHVGDPGGPASVVGHSPRVGGAQSNVRRSQLGAWGSRWLPVTEELSVRARLLADGGPALWQRFMAELRVEHLGVTADPPPDGRTVRERLHDAYLAAVKETGLQGDDASGSATHSPSRSVTQAG
jgi:hypothetical protein